MAFTAKGSTEVKTYVDPYEAQAQSARNYWKGFTAAAITAGVVTALGLAAIGYLHFGANLSFEGAALIGTTAGTGASLLATGVFTALAILAKRQEAYACSQTVSDLIRTNNLETQYDSE